MKVLGIPTISFQYKLYPQRSSIRIEGKCRRNITARSVTPQRSQYLVYEKWLVNQFEMETLHHHLTMIKYLTYFWYCLRVKQKNRRTMALAH